MSAYFSGDFGALTAAIGNAIRNDEAHAETTTNSGHVQILRDHGRDISASRAMIEVYAELAKPDTTGGVVVVLERPSSAEQTRYGGGYHTVLSKTKTLKEVAKLILLVTNGALTIDNVTILDAFPLQPNDDPALHYTTSSSELLNRLLAAKRPDIVISCFRAGPHKGLIRVLQHPGVGHQSNKQHTLVSVWRPHHQFKKVDAFHPSFAFTYHADDACFVQLLELQFAKAFGEWCGTWREAPWMDELRRKARAHKEPTSEQRIEEIILRINSIKLSDARRASRLAGFTIRTDY